MKESADSVTDSATMAVIGEAEEEMKFFKEHERDYGHTYYLMRAI